MKKKTQPITRFVCGCHWHSRAVRQGIALSQAVVERSGWPRAAEDVWVLASGPQGGFLGQALCIQPSGPDIGCQFLGPSFGEQASLSVPQILRVYKAEIGGLRQNEACACGLVA